LTATTACTHGNAPAHGGGASGGCITWACHQLASAQTPAAQHLRRCWPAISSTGRSPARGVGKVFSAPPICRRRRTTGHSRQTRLQRQWGHQVQRHGGCESAGQRDAQHQWCGWVLCDAGWGVARWTGRGGGKRECGCCMWQAHAAIRQGGTCHVGSAPPPDLARLAGFETAPHDPIGWPGGMQPPHMLPSLPPSPPRCCQVRGPVNHATRSC